MQVINYKKYLNTPIKLEKLKDNKFNNNHPGEINEGYIFTGLIDIEKSEDRNGLYVNSDVLTFHTSDVRKIEECEGYDLIHTRNSVYKVTPISSAIPGVQQKYALKID
jgi:hypothetical protein